jgi:hypothetical protein
MSQINPFMGSILGTPGVQRQQSVEKDRQVRRASDAEKDAALSGDELEHQVESSEELSPIHEDQHHERRFKKPRHHETQNNESDLDDDDQSHLDLTA